jgi:hypothetical protein
MSDSNAKKPPKAKPAKTTVRARAAKSDSGVLAGLSSTRPQRPSPRRAAARKAAVESTVGDIPGGVSPAKPTRPAKAKPPRPAKSTSKAKRDLPAPTPKRAARKRPTEPRVPRQGFEAESELDMGAAVHPPSGLDMAGSAVGLLGDLAQSGVARSGRLLRGALSRLPKP